MDVAGVRAAAALRADTFEQVPFSAPPRPRTGRRRAEPDPPTRARSSTYVRIGVYSSKVNATPLCQAADANDDVTGREAQYASKGISGLVEFAIQRS